MALLATRSIDPAERGAWLRLIRTRRVGPHSFWSLLDRFETAQAALAALPELSRQGGAKQPLQPFAADLAEQEYRTLRDLGGHLLVAVDGVFPPLLRQINDPPPVLSVRGNPDLLARPSVAMVGARNASTNGQRFAAALAQSLSAEGFSLTSGLARGIDAAVHHATVEDGQTVAVVAGGVDIIYPREHGELYQHLIDRALCRRLLPRSLCSSRQSTRPPRGWHQPAAPRRGRLGLFGSGRARLPAASADAPRAQDGQTRRSTADQTRR